MITFSMRQVLLILCVVVLGVGLLCAAWWWVNRQVDAQPRTSVAETGVSLTGNLTCLPKQGNGPHTMECAYGLLANGRYYALDMSQMSGDLFEYTFEDQLQVTGDVVDPDPQSTYAIFGTLKVRSIELLQGSI